MREYDIHPDFLKYGFVKPPLNPALLTAANSLMNFVDDRLPVPEELTETIHVINGYEDKEITVSVIRPKIFNGAAAVSAPPALVYFHGGGFALQLPPHLKRLAYDYALKTPCVVILPDYRLMHKAAFPAGLEDCYSTYVWACKNAHRLGINKDRIAVGGDSAGGALAAGVCLLARDRQKPLPRFQMLIYPVTDERQNTASMKLFKDTPMWNSELNAKMWEMYLRDGVPGKKEYASPMEAETLEGMPPAYVEVAEYDCLRDEGIAYAHALKNGGAKVWLYETKRTVHGFEIERNNEITVRCIGYRVDMLKGALYG